MRDLFGEVVSPAVLRQEAFFGKMDARCGLPLHNEDYSSKLSPERFAVYATAYRAEIALMRAEE